MLGNPGSFALGDEPLPGAVENQTGSIEMQPLPERREALRDLLHIEIRKEPVGAGKRRELPFEDRVERDGPLRDLCLQLPDPVRPDLDEEPEVPLEQLSASASSKPPRTFSTCSSKRRFTSLARVAATRGPPVFSDCFRAFEPRTSWIS